jgi:hypothetical protein
MSNFGVKRAAHRSWPQPTKPVIEAIVIVDASKPTPRTRAPTASLKTSPTISP